MVGFVPAEFAQQFARFGVPDPAPASDEPSGENQHSWLTPSPGGGPGPGTEALTPSCSVHAVSSHGAAILGRVPIPKPVASSLLANLWVELMIMKTAEDPTGGTTYDRLATPEFTKRPLRTSRRSPCDPQEPLPAGNIVAPCSVKGANGPHTPRQIPEQRSALSIQIGTLALVMLLTLVPWSSLTASVAVYVGKNLTEDGSVILAGYGDEPSSHWLEVVPRRKHAPGSTISVGVTAEARLPGRLIDIPQAAETFKFITMNYSYYAGPAPLTNGGMNEHHVAARDVALSSRPELVRMTPNPQRGPNYSDLSQIVMQRAKTAREAAKRSRLSRS